MSFAQLNDIATLLGLEKSRLEKLTLGPQGKSPTGQVRGACRGLMTAKAHLQQADPPLLIDPVGSPHPIPRFSKGSLEQAEHFWQAAQFSRPALDRRFSP